MPTNGFHSERRGRPGAIASLAARVSLWQVLLGAAFGLLAAVAVTGFRAGAYSKEVVTLPQLQRESEQRGALEIRVRGLEEDNRGHKKLDAWLVTAVDGIADKLGVKVPPPPLP